MSRPRFFRQRLLTQAGSLEAKGLFSYLVSEIRARREISLEEAVLVTQDVKHYLEQNLLDRTPGQIEFPAQKPAGPPTASGPGKSSRRGWCT